MPRIEGTGFSGGAGGWNGTHVALPQGTVKHRERPALRPSGFVVHNEGASFPPELLADDERRRAAKATRKPRRRDNGRRDGRHGLSVPAERIEEICELYKSGLSTKQVAQKAGASITTVLKYLHDQGVPVRPRGGQRLEVAAKSCVTCGSTFKRREGEKALNWRRRTTCCARCRGLLAAANRTDLR